MNIQGKCRRTSLIACTTSELLGEISKRGISKYKKEPLGTPLTETQSTLVTLYYYTAESNRSSDSSCLASLPPIHLSYSQSSPSASSRTSSGKSGKDLSEAGLILSLLSSPPALVSKVSPGKRVHYDHLKEGLDWVWAVC